jgi:dipeptidase E
MINLALYSDQIIPENGRIDARLLAVMQDLGLGSRIGYIPSGPEPSRRFFNERTDYYRTIGLDLCIYFDPDETGGAAGMEALFSCDAIHLPGGNTAGFLARLKRTGLLGGLRDWVLSGGMLIGTSAGAILMTQTIAVDALFSAKDPKDVLDGEALGLLPFEFFPHLNGRTNYLTDLIDYSRDTPRPIVACNDGEGVIVSNGRIEFIGETLWIADGDVRHARDIEGIFAGA